MQKEIAMAIERKAQALLDAGVPFNRLLIKAVRTEFGFTYSVHVKTDSEMWLDWLSDNHGFGAQA